MKTRAFSRSPRNLTKMNPTSDDHPFTEHFAAAPAIMTSDFAQSLEIPMKTPQLC